MLLPYFLKNAVATEWQKRLVVNGDKLLRPPLKPQTFPPAGLLVGGGGRRIKAVQRLRHSPLYFPLFKKNAAAAKQQKRLITRPSGLH